MSNINFRTYSNIIYGLISKNMEEYIIPEISKEEFKKMFEEGELKINNIKLKEGKNFSLDFLIFDDFSCEELKILIPDEKSYFELFVKNIKCKINIIELNYENIEKLLISNIKNLTDKFIEYSVNLITKQDNSPSMIEGFITNILNKIIQGFKFKIENFEINFQFNNIIFSCFINLICYNEKDGIQFDNINIFMIENSEKLQIINNFGLKILIENSNDIEKKENKLKIELKPLKIQINKKINIRLIELIQFIQYNKYKKLYFKKKLYIDYYKPKIENNIKDQIYHKKLWIFAIKTIIKLKKYFLGKLHLLEFTEEEQKKIINDYYNNNNNLNILSIDNKKILLYSKEKIEKSVIEYKKKPKLNPFAFFFGGNNNNENKNELNENEKEELNNLCKIENIENYLKGNIKNKKSSNPIENLIMTFTQKLIIEISLQTLNLELIHDKEHLNIFFQEITILLNKNENLISYQIILNDIYSINDFSIFNDLNNEKNALIINSSISKEIEIQFNFKNIHLNEKLIKFLLVYFLSLNIKKKYNEIFKENSNSKSNINNIISIFNRIKFSFIPSFSIYNEKDRITFNLNQINIKEDFSNISFNLSIENTDGEILPLYQFKILKENNSNNFKIDFVEQINLFLNEKFISFFINSFKTINKIKENVENKREEIFLYDNEEKFNYFNFNFEKNLDINQIKINSFNLDLNVNQLYIELIELKSISNLKIKDIKLIYKEKKFNLTLNDLYILTNKNSDFLLWILKFSLDNNNKNALLKEKNNNNNISDTNNIFGYLFRELYIIIKKFEFSFVFDDIYLNFLFYELKYLQLTHTINFNLSSFDFLLNDNKNSKNKKNQILKIKEEISFNYNFIKHFIKGKIKNPEFNLSVKLIFQIYKSLNFFVENLNSEGEDIKYNFEIHNSKINFMPFNINLKKISIIHSNNNLDELLINNLIISNKKIKIIEENELTIKYTNKKEEQNISLTFLNFFLSLTQNDIKEFIILLDKEYKNEYNKYIKENKKNISENKNLTQEFNINIKKFETNLFSENKKIFGILIEDCKITLLNTLIECNYSIQIIKSIIYYYDKQNNKIKVVEGIKISEKKEDLIKILGQNNIISIDLISFKILLRLDFFLSLYLFFKNLIPNNLLISQKKKKNTLPQIQINLIDSKYILQTSFDKLEKMILFMDEFNIIYDPIENLELPFGKYTVKIKSILTEFEKENIKRELFHTKSINYFLFFDSLIYKDLIEMDYQIQSIFISLSYLDIISFLKAYHLNYSYYKNENNIHNNNNNIQLIDNDNNNDYNNSLSNIPITGKINFKEIDIILIDNSTGSYYPFLNLNLKDKKTKIENINNININVSLCLNSYNYIACIWEPLIEKTEINFSYLKNEKINFYFENYDLLINLSDMNISFILVSLNNWINNFIEEKKKCELFDFENFEKSKNSQLKISNNEVFNFTGQNLKIKYANQIFDLKNNENLRLEYIKDWKKEFGKKEIIIIYNKNNYYIPIEKLGTRFHSINNGEYYISENTLNKDRNINISIYSPIIFKNNTLYNIIFCSDENDFFYVLNSGKKFGVPFNLIKSKTRFYFSLGENDIIFNDSSLSLNEIIDIKIEENYNKNICIHNKYLNIKLNRNIFNVRELVFICEFSIINCLPIDIELMILNKNYIIKKCNQFYLDFTSEKNFSFRINANEHYFFSDCDYWFKKDNDNYIEFYDNNNNFFYISKIKVTNFNGIQLIIYSENLIKNNTKINNLNIYSFDNNNNPFIYELKQNLFLISSKIKIEYNLKLNAGDFESNKIKMENLLSNNLKIYLFNNNDNIELNIYSQLSHIIIENNLDFNENIMSNIININSSCKIISMLSTKVFYIFNYLDNNFIRVNPMEKINFNYLNKKKILFGISNLNQNSPFHLSNEFNYKLGLYTFYMNDLFINLEIREDPKLKFIKIFVSESSINNCKIVIENKTKYIIGINEENYDNDIQTIDSNEKIILRMFSQENCNYLLHFKNQVHVLKEIDANIKQNKKIELDNNLFVNLISNGIKMHIIIYETKDKKNDIEKQLYSFKVEVKKIGISLIGDNEKQNKSLSNYKRKEILFFYFENIILNIDQIVENNIMKSSSIKINFNINKIKLYNQNIKHGKFCLVLKNENNYFCNLKADILYYLEDNISLINNLILSLDKMEIYLDPIFIISLIDFFSNIIYRMNLRNFQVNNIFINNTQKKEKNVFKDYNNKTQLYYGKNLLISSFDISFIISDININNLVEKYLKYSSFYSFIIKRITGVKHNININNHSINSFIGNLDELIMIILNICKDEIIENAFQMGIKGIFKEIINLFSNDNIEENYLMRPQRALYGKYQYIKNYNRDDSSILEKLKNTEIYKNGGFYFTYYLKGNKNIYIFTNLSFYIMDHNLNIIKNIDYFTVKDVRIDNKNTIQVNFNQKIDNSLSCPIKCEENIIQKIFIVLKEQIKINSDEILFI